MVEESSGEETKSASKENWDWFVSDIGNVEGVSPRFISILRNAGLVDLNEERITLSSNGQSRLENFPKKDQQLLASLLEEKFGVKIQLEILVEKSSETLTVKEKEDLQKQKEIEDKKKEAEKDPLVQAFLSEFPGSKIAGISIDKKKNRD